jgi:membrane associated rhomboid family serine protease
MPDYAAPQEPSPAALLLAMNLVTRRRLRLTHPSDQRLGSLAEKYDLGAAAWTGPRAAFVGFYTPPADPAAAGEDLAARCLDASEWGRERLGLQGAASCDILLIAMGPVAGSLAGPPDPGNPVKVGVISVDPATAQARELLPVPRSLPSAREVAAAAGAVKAGQPVPTLAAVDLAERQTVAGGYAAPAATALRQTPVLTFTMIGIWVVLWLVEVASKYTAPDLSTQYHLLDGGAFFTPTPDFPGIDWWRFLSSAFLHLPTNPLHILFNSYFMYVIGRYVELMYGRLVLLGTFLFSAIVGSFFVLAAAALGITGPEAAVGASGGLCGFVTLWFVLGFTQGKNVPAGVRDMLRRNAGINLVFILVFSFAVPGIAVSDHIGGFVGGALAGLILPPLARIGGRDLTIWEKVVIYALIALAAASVLTALITAFTPAR